MAKQIVTKAEGEAYRIEADGSKIKLRVGDLIDDGARIITETGASVRFEDEKGVPLEIGENTGTILFSDAGPELSGTLLAAAPQDAPAKETDAPTPDDAGAQNPLPSDSEGEDDSEAHSFVELPRIKYGSDINLQYARDVNVTSQIEGRASLNPRIKYDFTQTIVEEVQSYNDPRFPFDGGRTDSDYRPAAERHPITQDDVPSAALREFSASTPEDVPVTIDPMDGFVIPQGVELSLISAQAGFGTVKIVGGKLEYTPSPDFFGADAISVTVTDQSGRTYSGEIKIDVSPVHDPVDDFGTVRENSSVNIDALANDKFADLAGAKTVEVTQGEKGSVEINPDGTLKYTPHVDWLGEGETTTDTFTYTVKTVAGNYETANVTVTIIGTNDAPEISVITGAVTEDVTLTSSGNIITEHVTDLDATDTHTIIKVDGAESKVGQEITETYGKIVINADGSYTYTLNNDAGSVQSLGEGETYDEIFSVTVSDGHGGEATQNITITVNGTNDAPVISVEAGTDRVSAALSETNSGLTAGGTLTLTDVDITDNVSSAVTKVETSGATGGLTNEQLLAMFTTGGSELDGTETTDKINWTFDSGDKTFDYLAAGEKLTLTYTVQAKDDSGVNTAEGGSEIDTSNAQTVTITITGTNDAPVVTGTQTSASVAETDSGNLAGAGALSVTDMDITDTVTATVKSVSGMTNAAGEPSADELKAMLQLSKSGTLGSYADSAEVIAAGEPGAADNLHWKFDSGSAAFDYLQKGETATFTYKIELNDGQGGVVEKNITVTVTGSNDSPLISVESGYGDADSKAFGQNDAALSDGTAGGTLTLADADLKDKVGVSVEKVEIDGSAGSAFAGTLPAGLTDAALKEMLSVQSGNILSDKQTAGQFTWNFDSGSGGEFKFLAEGETLTLKYTVKADDGQGVAADQTDPYQEASTSEHVVTIVITGSNDAPVVTGSSDVPYRVVEDVTTTATAEANIIESRVSDADTTDKLSVTKVNGADVTSADTEIAGKYGGLVISPDGKYHYVLDNSRADTQALQMGQTEKEIFTVTVSDGRGGTVEQTITVNVTGRNDSPDIQVKAEDSAIGAGKEGSLSAITGTLTLTDADTADVVSAHSISAAIGGRYDSFDALKGAGYKGDSGSVLQMLKLKLTGGDDSTYSSKIAEALKNTETGSDGNITWKFDAGGEKFNFLNEGESITITYTITADDQRKVTTPADGNKISSDVQTVVITITGTNSVPTLKNDTASVTEDNGFTDGTAQSVATGPLNIFTNDTDVDFNGKSHWKVIGAKESTAGTDEEVIGAEAVDIDGKYGTLHIKADGGCTYTLRNDSNAVQQLGHDGTLADEFTITMQDGSLNPQTEKLTINIAGTNDAPEITIADGDSRIGAFSESAVDTAASTPEAKGTLTFSDIDLGDTVTVTKLALSDADFTISGPQDGLISSREELYNMLSLSNFTMNTSDGANSQRFNWSFDSGDERFNYLKANESLVLTYKVKATDDSGVANNKSDVQTIVITINGAEQTGAPLSDKATVAEDKHITIKGHSGTLSGENQNLLYNDDSDGAIASFKVKGDDTQYGVGKDVDVKIDGNTIGTINIKANGEYTFTAKNHYSGAVPQITYTTTADKSATLDITVTPVADAPTWTTPKPSGNEDAKIDLGLKLPKITDDQDLNGTAAAGDHPERLGYITISGIPAGAVIYNGDQVLDATDKIVIVNGGNLDTALHYTGLSTTDAGVVQLTRKQFEALTIKPPAESGTNLTGIKLSVTSFEVDDDGKPMDGIPEAVGEAVIKVEVLAETDAVPDIKFGGGDSVTKATLGSAVANGSLKLTNTAGDTITDGVKIGGTDDAPVVTINEDQGVLVITKEALTTTLTDADDIDGSEHYRLQISGLEQGTVVNGVTAGADGSVTLDMGGITNADISSLLQDLKITTPTNFNGDMSITVTAQTQDTDADSPNAAPAVHSDLLTLTLHVDPVADGLQTIGVSQAKIYEDTFGGVKNGSAVSEAFKALDIRPQLIDGKEKANITIKGIQAGSTIAYGGTDVAHQHQMTGDSRTLAGGIELTKEADGSYTVTITDFKTNQFYIKPPLDSNEDFDLKISGTTTDGTLTSVPSGEVTLHVDVIGVADPVTIEQNAANLTFKEDEGISINKFYVKPSDNADNSETVTLKITGLADGFSIADSDNVRFLGGSGADRAWLVTNPTESNLLLAPKNFSGTIELKAQAVSTENDGNSAKSQLDRITLTVEPLPEAEMTNASSVDEDAYGKVDFSILYKNGDTDEELTSVMIKVSDVGTGKHFGLYYSADGHYTALGDSGFSTEVIDGETYYKLTDGQWNNIYAKGDADWSGRADFGVKYRVTDYKYGETGTGAKDGAENSVTKDMTYTLTVKPVSDTPTMAAAKIGDMHSDSAAAEISQDAASGVITAKFTTVFGGEKQHLTFDAHVNAPQDGSAADKDGSEHLVRIEIEGVPDGVKVDGAAYMGDSTGGVQGGRWVITCGDGETFDAAQLVKNVKFTIDPSNKNLWSYDANDIPITIKAVTQDSSGELRGAEMTSKEITWNLNIDFTSGPGGAEDIPAPYMEITKAADAIEDTETTLGQLVNVEFYHDAGHTQPESCEFRFELTIEGLPKGVKINGAEIDGTSFKLSGFGSNKDVAALLANTKIEYPQNYNSNHDGTGDAFGDGAAGLQISWKTEGWNLDGHGKDPANASEAPVQVDSTVTPVTDAMLVTVASDSASCGENQAGGANNIGFSVTIADGADGTYGKIAGDTLYIKIGGASSGDRLSFASGGTDLAYDADKGAFVLTDADLVHAGASLDFTYHPAEYSSGARPITASLSSQEAGAANPETASGTLDLSVDSANSGYVITAENTDSLEDAAAELRLSGGLLDTDGSEKVYSAILSGFSDTEKFTVTYGDSEADAKSASKFYNEGTREYEWSIETNADGSLPKIFVKSLENYSSVEHLKLTVLSGEKSLFPDASADAEKFTLIFKPDADGITDFTPTKSTGEAGIATSLNLNGTVVDTDGSETVCLKITGLGDGVTFYNAGDRFNEANAVYDSVTDSYQLSGIAWDGLGKITFTCAERSGTMTIEAWTVDKLDGYDDSISKSVTGDVDYNIAAAAGRSFAMDSGVMMVAAFAPLDPVMQPDGFVDYGDASSAVSAGGGSFVTLTPDDTGIIDFSALSQPFYGSLDLTDASAQHIAGVDPYGAYAAADASHRFVIDGTSIDDVTLADAPDAHWGAPELSADGSHYSYTATGDFDHDAATPDETVTLNVSRAIYDDTLAYDAHAMNDGGLGDDTLTFGHKDSTVDFSGGAASHIANIERFDLGEGDHSLENITAKDVFNMTDARGTLTINGDNADHVTLSDVLDDATDGMWESSPFQSVESGVSYSVYTGSFEGHMVTLKIEDEIIQQLTTHTKG